MGLITIQSQGTTNDVKGRFQLLWHEVQNCFQILEYNVIPNIIIITFSKKKKRLQQSSIYLSPYVVFDILVRDR
jgi:hypothetical protein